MELKSTDIRILIFLTIFFVVCFQSVFAAKASCKFGIRNFNIIQVWKYVHRSKWCNYVLSMYMSSELIDLVWVTSTCTFYCVSASSQQQIWRSIILFWLLIFLFAQLQFTTRLFCAWPIQIHISDVIFNILVSAVI